MKKLVIVFLASLLAGCLAGVLLYYGSHWTVEERFEPYNRGAETEEIRPSA